MDLQLQSNVWSPVQIVPTASFARLALFEASLCEYLVDTIVGIIEGTSVRSHFMPEAASAWVIYEFAKQSFLIRNLLFREEVLNSAKGLKNLTGVPETIITRAQICLPADTLNEIVAEIKRDDRLPYIMKVAS